MRKNYENPTVNVIRYETPDVVLLTSGVSSDTNNYGVVDLTSTNGKLRSSWLHS